MTKIGQALKHKNDTAFTNLNNRLFNKHAGKDQTEKMRLSTVNYVLQHITYLKCQNTVTSGG